MDRHWVDYLQDIATRLLESRDEEEGISPCTRLYWNSSLRSSCNPVKLVERFPTSLPAFANKPNMRDALMGILYTILIGPTQCRNWNRTHRVRSSHPIMRRRGPTYANRAIAASSKNFCYKWLRPNIPSFQLSPSIITPSSHFMSTAVLNIHKNCNAMTFPHLLLA